MGVTASCVLAAIPAFWTLATRFWSGAAAAAGVAAVNAVSGIASFLGPFLTGALTETTGGFAAALLTTAAFLALSGVGALAMRRLLLSRRDAPTSTHQFGDRGERFPEWVQA